MLEILKIRLADNSADTSTREEDFCAPTQQMYVPIAASSCNVDLLVTLEHNSKM